MCIPNLRMVTWLDLISGCVTSAFPTCAGSDQEFWSEAFVGSTVSNDWW